MLYLVDTGVLLRLFNRKDPNCGAIRNTLWKLRKAGHQFAVSLQNVAEFWNVATRPVEARGGYGLSVADAERRLRVIERICVVLPDSSNLYAVWRGLLTAHSVKGVHVHDTRLVAWMLTQGISHIITLNSPDFARFPGIITISPSNQSSNESE